jgi:hypothetical protein
MTTFALVLGSVVLLVMFVSFGASLLIDRTVASTSPRGIGEQLHRAGTHVVAVPADRFTWNPSLPPGTANRLYGPGTATYRNTESGEVQLDFVAATGRTGTWTGPLPAEFAEPVRASASPYSFAKPVLAVAGIVVGLLIADGSTRHVLLVGVTLGLIGWLVAAVAVMTTSMVTRTRAFAAQSSAPNHN